jgi:hypothetical protein
VLGLVTDARQRGLRRERDDDLAVERGDAVLPALLQTEPVVVVGERPRPAQVRPTLANQVGRG